MKPGGNKLSKREIKRDLMTINALMGKNCEVSSYRKLGSSASTNTSNLAKGLEEACNSMQRRIESDDSPTDRDSNKPCTTSFFPTLCDLIRLSASSSKILQDVPGDVPGLINRAIFSVAEAMITYDSYDHSPATLDLSELMKSTLASTEPFNHNKHIAKMQRLLDRAQQYVEILESPAAPALSGAAALHNLPDGPMLVLLYRCETKAAWFCMRRFPALLAASTGGVLSAETGTNEFTVVSHRLLVTGPNACFQHACSDIPEDGSATLVRGLPPVMCVNPFPVEDHPGCVSVFATTADGLYAWGANPKGILGVVTQPPVVKNPRKIELDSPYPCEQILRSQSATFFFVGGEWFAAGQNSACCLGTKSTEPTVTPPQRIHGCPHSVAGFYSFSDSAGNGVTFAITTSRTNPVMACGSNELGQLGVGTQESVTEFKSVVLPRHVGITEVACIKIAGRLAVTIFFSDDNRLFVSGHNPAHMIFPTDSEFLITPQEIPFDLTGCFVYRSPRITGPRQGIVYSGRDVDQPSHNIMHVAQGADTGDFQTKPSCHGPGWEVFAIPAQFNTVEFFGLGLFAIRTRLGDELWDLSPTEGPGALCSIHGQLYMSSQRREGIPAPDM
ncbi:putative X-linked retinitis pigmentosa GTPase regulator [Carpediemonas membranifera]|uniref:Putative X-linked retinitis pigmentosa GTPase regulator n=1 Tax=Carpediemonas membranifera TaxID=201153 RepID=A0A8J6E0Q8_9EUKA|nr:putative X-linked retinitis pigmentosa GTPase regulator [Carpediemonas membranifera]|eukprot:KAG9395424.1 putative X-linked retinitis pigmentosa GTPase regulator [Carpediemonas membranifera]